MGGHSKGKQQTGRNVEESDSNHDALRVIMDSFQESVERVGSANHARQRPMRRVRVVVVVVAVVVSNAQDEDFGGESKSYIVEVVVVGGGGGGGGGGGCGGICWSYPKRSDKCSSVVAVVCGGDHASCNWKRLLHL